MNRIDRPRFSIRGDVLATFYPRSYNGWNTRISPRFLRKGLGHRKRGRAWQNAVRAHRVRITPEQVDYLVQATMSKVIARREAIALDRKRTPCTFMFEGIPIYLEEMT